MKKIYPPILAAGDEVRVIAPSRSPSILSEELKSIANERFAKLGLKLSFGRHINEVDDFLSSSIESRIEDIHEAFSDKNVKAILTVIGGFNSNQLLDYIDWELLKKNSKILCGFSDITALNNSIFAKTGLVTYSGPHYSTFGQKLYFEYTLEYFKKCLFDNKPFELAPSSQWSDDRWYKNQEERNNAPNEGYWLLCEGQAEGTILGGNLCTFNLLQGTSYMPNLEGTVLFLEDDSVSQPHDFDRDLQSLIHQPGFSGVKGIVIGRFQNESHVNKDLLSKIIKSKKELKEILVVANLDFGHTDPKITFPVGGEAQLTAINDKVKIEITKH